MVWSVLILYLTLIVTLNIPGIQEWLGEKVAYTLAEKLGTRVEIRSIAVGPLNRMVADDICIYDKQHKKMVAASRLSARLELSALATGRISISSAQLFGANINLYQTTPDSRPNFQFAIDALASKDTTQGAPLNLRVNSLIIRKGRVRYNRHFIAPTPGVMNTSHIDASDISAHIVLKALREDSINVNIKKISLREHCGLNVEKLAMKLVAGKRNARLSDLYIKLHNSHMEVPEISAEYKSDSTGIIPASLRYKGRIAKSDIEIADIAPLARPLNKQCRNKIALSLLFNGTGTNFRVTSLSGTLNDNEMLLDATAWMRSRGDAPEWYADIARLHLAPTAPATITACLKPETVKLPGWIGRIGAVNATGTAGATAKGKMAVTAGIHTDAGDVSVKMNLDKNGMATAIAETGDEGINLAQLLDNKKLGYINAKTTAAGHIATDKNNKQTPTEISVKAEIGRLDYNGYRFSGITAEGVLDKNSVSGKVNIADPNAQIAAEGNINKQGSHTNIKLNANISNFSPRETALSDKWKDARFAADISVDFAFTDINDATGRLDISHLNMMSAEKDYNLKQLSVTSGFNAAGKHFATLSSDFGKAEITGHIDYNRLQESLAAQIGTYLPELPGLSGMHTGKNLSNSFTLSATITKSDWAENLLNFPVRLTAPANIEIALDDKHPSIEANIGLPEFYISGKPYRSGKINITSPGDSLCCNIQLTKIMANNEPMQLKFHADATHGNLVSAAEVSLAGNKPLAGTLNTSSVFTTDTDGKPYAEISILPSQISLSGAKWDVHKSKISLKKDDIRINAFAITHNNQHIFVNGAVTPDASDRLSVDLQGIDVGYILNLVNFHAVEFGGRASGRAYINGALGRIEAYGKMMVNDFTFENGRMGVLDADVSWNAEKKQIDINATADNGPQQTTYINGYVSPAHNRIDLGIEAAGTNIEFLESFTGSFMDNVKGSAKGKVSVVGPLNEINLVGQLAVNGEADIIPLGCKYFLRNDTVKFIPNEIILCNMPVYDTFGNKGMVSGQLHHRNLSRLTYDLNVKATNLLGYNFPDFGESNICGVVFATGNVDIIGRKGELTINVDATPQPGSTFGYNVATPDAIADNEFIVWRDKATASSTGTTAEENRREGNNGNTKSHDSLQPENSSDTRINFLVNCTPDATIRLRMDSKGEDYITLNGNGVIRATYYNKGPFTMFGTYVVDHGTYGITIQDILKKNFTFNEGGTIVFGGDPFNASLNLQAVHTANGVSLADLNIGNSFTSSTTKVNCLMNISGQPLKPQINFDIDMPTVSTDEKQMIRSLINSEEEMNQQVVYLLGVGRFYPQGNNNATSQDETQQSQTSLAMQSLLSGTISGQINNVLNTVIKSNTWNFGANISTGDEGWNNAEYEGLLSGRLLNNRLLINGQFGYRDNSKTASPSFIGDFDIRYLLNPAGNFALKIYNQTNDRYFTNSSLNTQGIGIIMKKDFNGLGDLFGTRKKKKAKK